MEPKKQLSLLDASSMIIGIIIGVGIYEASPTIAKSSGSWQVLLLLWVIGGTLSLTGALCYAELSSTYPEDGGDYAYLRRAYGRWAGFLFAWAQAIIVRPGSIAAVSFPFVHYLNAFLSPDSAQSDTNYTTLLGCTAVALLTVINIIGVREGKWTQNLLTAVKVGGLLLITFSALLISSPTTALTPPSVVEPDLTLAMILILFTYGGWNEISYVAGEVTHPEKNMLRSLLIGTTLVTLIYILVNWAFITALGYEGLASSDAAATQTVRAVFPTSAGRVVSLLICISALGGLNGMIFTGARLYYVLGKECSIFSFLTRWSGRRNTPVPALLTQGILSIALIIWSGSFKQAVVYTTSVVWFFFLLTGLSVFILRSKDKWVSRPYKILGHPLTTIVFCLSCVFLVYSSVTYDYYGTFLASALLLAGLPFFFFQKAPPIAK